MRPFLLYCIFRAHRKPAAGAPVIGLGATPVTELSAGGLSGCVSRIAGTLPMDTGALMTYKDVIEIYHGQRDVIPLRYGSLFETEAHIHDVLCRRRAAFKRCLDSLHGCVEMGLRIPIPESAAPEVPQPHGNGCRTPGKAFLERRRAVYGEEEKGRNRIRARAAHMQSAFSGIYCQWRMDHRKAPHPDAATMEHPMDLVSLYFLIPRRACGAFRDIFNRMRFGKGETPIMTGPWPPYNFVTQLLEKGER
jgi:hypothetical protein